MAPVDAQSQLTDSQTALYERLQAFRFDPPDVAFSFQQRLARENRWSLDYAQRAIAEYKKFALLAVTAGHPVTPSDQVDRVWHLHLTYTHSYWDELCPQVLQCTWHHEPTQGGDAEAEKFADWYQQTLASYEQYFGSAPPADLWPAPELRFGRDRQFVWANVQENWLVSKSQARLTLQASLALLLGLALGAAHLAHTPASQPLVTLALVLAGSLTGWGAISFLGGIARALLSPPPYGANYGWGSDGTGMVGSCGYGSWGDSSCDAGCGSGCGGCGGCGG